MNNFWKASELRQIHIELTNNCNAACPMCVRFHRNSPLVRPDLEIGQITLDKFKEYFPKKILKPLHKIMFCGVHGDPGMARDLLDICEYLHHNTTTGSKWFKKLPFILQMYTNGGMRDEEWWAKLGKVFSQRNMYGENSWRIIFSIDGLADTNHIYRRNVNWDKLMNNAQAFINNGGIAVWEFLIFKHNEHQIEEARALSKKLGFKVFIPKKALGVDDGEYTTPLPAMNKDGQLDYIIEAPVLAENRNLAKTAGDLPLRYRTFNIIEYKDLKKDKSDENYQSLVNSVYDQIKNTDLSKLDNCSIVCKAKKEWGGKEIFVDSTGRVIPCCYIGTHVNGTYDDIKSLQVNKHLKDYGWEYFDLNKYSLEEILNAGHLNKVFADSWNKASILEGKLAYCADTCGKSSGVARIYEKGRMFN